MPRPTRLPVRIPVLWAALLGAALLPAAAPAQERATGSVTVEQPPPEPRGVTVTTPDGRVVEVPRGQAFDVSGANVVVERETPKGTTLTMQNDVLFDFDKADVLPKAEETLTKAANIIKERGPKGSVRVEGYTDSKGDDNYNMKLSVRRAESIRDWLSRKGGLSAVKFDTKGFGETQPVAPNTNPDGSDNPEGRAKNRRVTIVFGR